MEDLKKMEDNGKNSCEEILRKLQSIEYESESLNLENTKLKVLCVRLCVYVLCNENLVLLVQVVWNNSMFNIMLLYHFVLYVSQSIKVSL